MRAGTAPVTGFGTMNRAITLVIAPNEDGFGTSAWVVRLVKELVRQGQGSISLIKVVVATDKLQGFHKDKYLDLPVEIIRLEGITKRIELVKKAGSLDIPGSIEQAILPYAESRAEYALALRKQNVFDDVDVVIDLGVPQLVRAAYQVDLSRMRASEKRLVSVTILDHAWSLSLRRIAFSNTAEDTRKQIVENAITNIENDEALTQQAIVFGEPISPLDYHGHWRKLLGHFPMVIPGSLGGPLSTLAYANDPNLAQVRSEMETDGQCPQEAYEKARQYARRILGISNDLPTLFVSGGGTSTWDEVLDQMIDDYESDEPNYNVVIYSPVEAKRRGASLKKRCGVEVGIYGRNERLVFIGQISADTHHILFPAFDLVLTRAGGGTVNDALACAVPLILAEEPGMWQVEQIRQSCLRMQIAEGVTLGELRSCPRVHVESQDGHLRKMDEQRNKILLIPNHSEIWVVQELLRMIKSDSTSSTTCW